jgi:putative membrane-bound dehydrogenase-like protein
MKRAACWSFLLPFSLLALAVPAAGPKPAATDVPRAADGRLVVERFAVAPDIVHPVGLDVDARGRVLVIESHTHFPPKDYKGPKHDRIRIFEDTKGTGKADRISTFFEGTRATMDIAVHPDGSVYLATRNEVLRLRDTRGTGKADQRERLVFLDTRGDYPHNGLSGLCFDWHGDLYFGIGENLGENYRLVGSDGTTLRGGGEGGNVFWCTADGKKLRRVATGFWNPFGVCQDIQGRLFAVDNDPDAMPPCRLVHVVEGGDYGYQFRYGRSGRHPFQCWDGQLPGTLPMISGTGEAPCEVLSYESDGLPAEYLGNLLVTSWADHRVERYFLHQRGASFSAVRKPFVQGGENFRPVGLAVAPDGSLFVSDWVRSDYQLHGKGAIWHIRPRKPHRAERPKDPRQALLSRHRPLREAAARQLAGTEAGRDLLRRQAAHTDVRVRAACLTALIDRGDRKLDLRSRADKDPDPGLRALAVRALAARGDARSFLDSKYPPSVRLEAIASLRGSKDADRLLGLLTDTDPFLRSAAVQQLGRNEGALARLQRRRLQKPLERCGLLLALRASGRAGASRRVPDFLADADEEVRFLALKWIADDRLSAFWPLVVQGLKEPTLNVRMYTAFATALARLEGREVSEAKMADHFAQRLLDDKAPADLLRRALQQVPARHPKLTIEVLGKLLARDDPALQREVVQTLAEHPSPKHIGVLLGVAHNDKLSEGVRALALAALAEDGPNRTEELFSFTRSASRALRHEALRALVGARLGAAQVKQLKELARQQPEADLVARVLGQPFTRGRPNPKDLDGWLKRLAGPADAEAGRRIFFHPRLATCSRCHRCDGRGQDIGPDLSTIGRRERRFILESILQPSALVAPHYQVWSVTTDDGRTRLGMLVGTQLDEYTYVDQKGLSFKVNTRRVVESRAVPTSLMPDGLADLLTDQELRDLLAYLAARR